MELCKGRCGTSDIKAYRDNALEDLSAKVYNGAVRFAIRGECYVYVLDMQRGGIGHMGLWRGHADFQLV